jgi:hypothetical protein
MKSTLLPVSLVRILTTIQGQAYNSRLEKLHIFGFRRLSYAYWIKLFNEFISFRKSKHRLQRQWRFENHLG